MASLLIGLGLCAFLWWYIQARNTSLYLSCCLFLVLVLAYLLIAYGGITLLDYFAQQREFYTQHFHQSLELTRQDAHAFSLVGRAYWGKLKHEYHEGPEALEKFKRGMEALFRVPKSVAQKKKQARKPATLRKPKKSGKDKV